MCRGVFFFVSVRFRVPGLAKSCLLFVVSWADGVVLVEIWLGANDGRKAFFVLIVLLDISLWLSRVGFLFFNIHGHFLCMYILVACCVG